MGLGGSLHTIDIDSITEPLIFQTDETLVFRIGVFERQGINYLQHAALYLNNAGDELRSSDYDTSIVFDKYSEDLITVNDPHGLLQHGEFKLLERDTTLLILQFTMTFDSSMDASNLYFVSWNEDKHPTYKTYSDVLTIKPLSIQSVDVEGVEEYLEASYDVNTEELLVIDDSIPYWVKSYVEGWTNNEISDYEFFNSLKSFITHDEYLYSTSVIDDTHSDEIPHWIKQYARLWVDDKISNSDFIYVISHLVKTGVLSDTTNSYLKHVEEKTLISDAEKIESKIISDLSIYAKEWKLGHLSDDEFFNVIHFVIFGDSSQSLSIVDISSSDKISDWVKQHAQKFKNSDVDDEEIISVIYHLSKNNLMEN